MSSKDKTEEAAVDGGSKEISRTDVDAESDRAVLEKMQNDLDAQVLQAIRRSTGGDQLIRRMSAQVTRAKTELEAGGGQDGTAASRLSIKPELLASVASQSRRPRKGEKGENSEAVQKFDSFDNNAHAKGFQIKIENYNELELFDIENKMRKVVGQLVDPIVVQQNNDREDFIKFQHKIHGIDEKVFVLENILFEKDENGRM